MCRAQPYFGKLKLLIHQQTKVQELIKITLTLANDRPYIMSYKYFEFPDRKRLFSKRSRQIWTDLVSQTLFKLVSAFYNNDVNDDYIKMIV